MNDKKTECVICGKMLQKGKAWGCIAYDDGKLDFSCSSECHEKLEEKHFGIDYKEDEKELIDPIFDKL
jgi:hypothetical protein